MAAQTAPKDPIKLTSPRASFFGGMFRAFGYRQFTLMWSGAFTSSIGTWMQKLAQNWLVLSITGSAFMLGLDAFLGDAPILLFSLVGGVIADRVDRRTLLLASQYLQMTFALFLATLLFFGVVEIWHILVLSFLTGTAQAFGGPAYQALLPTLVGRKDVPNAIALNSIQFNLARIIGPLLAGITLARVGLAACFGLNGLSFLAPILSLKLLHVNFIPRPSGERILHDMRGGFAFVRGRPALIALIALAFASTFLGIPLITLLPLFARDVFGIGASGYSGLMAFSGMGAVVGALLVAGLGNLPHRGRNTLLLQAIFGTLVITFALSRNLVVSKLVLFLAGIALMAVFSLISSLVQLIVPDDMRGRVMSIYMLAFRGGMPLGSLTVGFLASDYHPAFVLACGGALLVLTAALFFSLNRELRSL